MTSGPRLSIRKDAFILVLLSIIPIGQRAIESSETGVFLPIYVFVCSALALALALLVGANVVSKAILRVWGLFLIIYAAIRILIGVAAHMGGIDSAHVRDASSVAYFVVSLAIMLIGARLLKIPLWNTCNPDVHRMS